ncbi:MAG: nitroreductase family protein [Bdellovibrionales bacterium]|nr:nitroreductase family protein [Bdellovibrionales bacterium]
MDFFEAVARRRSIRKFTDEVVPESVIEKALEAAVLAPNSSNVQTWDFYWVQTPEKKARLVEACLGQSAARTANQLVVVVADPKKWKRSKPALVEWVKKANAPKPVHLYYEKLIPVTYTWGPLNSFGLFKAVAAFFTGIFRPILRGPFFKRDLQEVAIKSAALAAENFVLAVSAQGYSTCMMEGHDENRVKKLLGLPSSARVTMVIGIGRAHERGTWGPQMRLPNDQVIHRV